MTARAYVQHDWQIDGLRIGVQGRGEDGYRIVTYFPQFTTRQVSTPGVEATTVLPDGQVPYLTLSVDEARAIYEALADYFGNATNDTRLLRKDYEAERARVDRLIGYALSSVQVQP